MASIFPTLPTLIASSLQPPALALLPNSTLQEKPWIVRKTSLGIATTFQQKWNCCSCRHAPPTHTLPAPVKQSRPRIRESLFGRFGACQERPVPVMIRSRTPRGRRDWAPRLRHGNSAGGAALEILSLRCRNRPDRRSAEATVFGCSIPLCPVTLQSPRSFLLQRGRGAASSSCTQ